MTEPIKYEKEIDSFLKELFDDRALMTESEYNQFISTVDKQLISNDIEVGVKNGYSVEHQMQLFKSMITLNKKK